MIEENEIKKEYLRNYEKAVRQMKRSKEIIREIRLDKMCPSVINDGMPHGSNQDDLSSYMALLDKEWKKYIKYRYERAKLCTEIKDKINHMENEDEKDVLMYRYIKLMKWEDIVVKMELNERQIYRIHAQALKNFKMS